MNQATEVPSANNLGAVLDKIEADRVEVGFDAFAQKLAEDLKAYAEKGAPYLSFQLSPMQARRLKKWAAENGLEDRVRVHTQWGHWHDFMFVISSPPPILWPRMQFVVGDDWSVRLNDTHTTTLKVPSGEVQIITTHCGGGGSGGSGTITNAKIAQHAIQKPKRGFWRWRVWR